MSAVIQEFAEKLFIDGSWRQGEGGRIPVENPATGEVIGHIAAATPAEIDAAVAAARKAFKSWSRLPPVERSKALKRLGDAIAAEADGMARTMTMEQGKPLNEAKGEILKLAEACHFYAEEAVRIHGEIIPNSTNDHESLVMREPIGVVGAITPWNYPAELIGWKLCAALAAGCTIIIKPAELTPFTALAIASMAEKAQDSSRRRQCADRPRLEGRAGHGRASRHRQDRLHRLQRRRPAHPAILPDASSACRWNSAAIAR